jgi:hypothetical protein
MPGPQMRRPASGSSVRLKQKRDLFLKTEIKYPEMTNTIAALNHCACGDQISAHEMLAYTLG